MRILSTAFALLLFAIVSAQPCRAQHEFDVWCFGQGCGLRFTSGGPVPFLSGSNSREGSASIADPATGALLFYCDGTRALNGTHAPMPNGTGLSGSFSSTQTALIVPAPGDRSRWYLFTADAGEYIDPSAGIRYSIVDMRLDAGRGDVVATARNIPLLAPATEKLTAVRHANGCDYWIIAHAWAGNAFHAWRLTSAGVDTEPVISTVGTVHLDPPGRPAGTASTGYMKASPDGRFLAVAVMATDSVELFRFDDATGRVSSPVYIPVPPRGLTEPAHGPYGLAFSPNSSRLYISYTPEGLYHCTVTAPDPAATLALISDQHNPDRYDIYAALQLAPDGRIYHARSGGTWLGAVRNPDGDAASCDYTARAVDLGRPVAFGLPNMIESWFVSRNLVCGAPAAEFTPGDTVICAGSCLTFTDRSANDPTEWEWSFEGASVAAVNRQNPGDICFPDAGTFRVTLRASNPAGSGVATHTVHVLARGSAHAHLELPASAAPGEEFTAVLVLDEPLDAAALADLLASFRFRAGTLQLLDIDISGGILAGWRLDSVRIDNVAGHAGIGVTAPPGSVLQGIGRIAVLRFRAFIGESDTSAVSFEIGSGVVPCLAAMPDPTVVKVEICGVENRLISMGAGGYTLDPNRPNPFNPSTVIPFSIGLDGHVRLEIVDALGRTIAVLVDEPRRVGSYSAVWNAEGQPSGMYTCRMVSGPFTAQRAVVLVK